ncbi:hypothetical protein SCA03_29040 [Streptomyces cacaoi]|uniref:Uncharacterized protein n=1 Tax=Streptomyces cacaoi TaxID=1898 RepID=A0A4Y3R0Q6_STRCI|nr:hypothetical protein SCA03_29040 [Streptomyces cacaoi]
MPGHRGGRDGRNQRGIEEELVRMRAYTVLRGAMPFAYNPDGGKRVKQAWQRYSESQRPLGASAPQPEACP